MDLDIHCETPAGKCYWGSKSVRAPLNFCELDVDRMGHAFPNQVENIFLTLKNAPDGDYKYSVKYFSGGVPDVPFTFVVNQMGKRIDEGSGIANTSGGNYDCVTLTVKNKKITKTNFHLKTKNIPTEE